MEIKFQNGDIYVPKILGGGGGKFPQKPPFLPHCPNCFFRNILKDFTDSMNHLELIKCTGFGERYDPGPLNN